MKRVSTYLKQLFIEYKQSVWGNYHKRDKELTEDVVFSIGWTNLMRILPMCVALIITEPICFLLDLIYKVHTLPIWYFYLVELFLFLLGCIFFIIINKVIKQKNPSLSELKVLYHLFWFSFLFICCFLILIDGISLKRFNSAVLLYFLITIVPIFSLIEMCVFINILNTTQFLAVIIGIISFRDCIYSVLIYSLFSIPISFMMYKTNYIKFQTEKKLGQVNKQLAKKAITDSLTGVLNRWGFHEFLPTWWERYEKDDAEISLVIIDIDFFKEYNDCFGHYQGDECLRCIALSIQVIFGELADGIARIGGEEFFVLLSDIPKEKIKELLCKMQNQIEKLELESGNKSVSETVTVSVGIASSKTSCVKSWKELYKNADRALYGAKESGRNKIVESN